MEVKIINKKKDVNFFINPINYYNYSGNCLVGLIPNINISYQYTNYINIF